jgi:uncharacterized protein YdaU (DUF1376 family)
MKWYARDPLRALEGMAELTLEEVGAYNLLIDHAYCRDGDLPDNQAMISRMLRCHWRTWRAIKDRLLEKDKIRIEGGKIIPNGVQETLKNASRLSQKQSKNASKRWQKWKKDNGIKENEEIWHNQVASTTIPIPIKKEEEGTSGGYAFESGVIRLNQKNLDLWKKSFSHLDVPAELVAMTNWANSLPGGKWFNAVANALAKKNRAQHDKPASKKPFNAPWTDAL